MPRATHILTTGTTRVLCPVVARRLGKSATLVLHQLHYWLSKENEHYGTLFDGFQWIRNSYNQWHKQIQFLSLSTIRRAFAELEALGIIKSHHFDHQRHYAGGDQVKSYTIDYHILESVVGDLQHTLFTRPGSPKKSPAPLSASSTTHTFPQRAGDRDRNTASFSRINVSYSPKKPSFSGKNTPVQMSTPPVHLNIPANNIYLSKPTVKTISSSEVPTESLVNKTPNNSATHTQVERDKTLISHEMIRLWNTIIEQTENKIALTPQRATYLYAAFEQFFKNDMHAWGQLCRTIASSKFLMGEVSAFKANLDWVLKFSTLQRLVEGAYSTGDRVVSYKQNTSSSHPSTASSTPNEGIDAINLRQHLQTKVDEASYTSWFLKTYITFTTDETGKKRTILHVPSLFVRDRIRTHYRDLYESYFDEIQVGIPLENVSVPLEHDIQTAVFYEKQTEPKDVLPILDPTDHAPDLTDPPHTQITIESLLTETLSKTVQNTPDEDRTEERIDPVIGHDIKDQLRDTHHDAMIRQPIQQTIGKDAYICWFKETTFGSTKARPCIKVSSFGIQNRLLTPFHMRMERMCDGIEVPDDAIPLQEASPFETMKEHKSPEEPCDSADISAIRFVEWNESATVIRKHRSPSHIKPWFSDNQYLPRSPPFLFDQRGVHSKERDHCLITCLSTHHSIDHGCKGWHRFFDVRLQPSLGRARTPVYTAYGGKRCVLRKEETLIPYKAPDLTKKYN